MNGITTRSSSFLHQILLAEAHPRGLARGCAFGIMLGLIPKFNLLAVAMLMAMFLARVNLLATLASCAMVSLFAYHLDPIFNRIGGAILMFEPLQPVYCGLLSIPWLAWSGFDNTAVMGAFIVGLLQMYPTHYLVRKYLTGSPRIPHCRESHPQRIVS